MEDIELLFIILEELQQQEESYIKDLRIADILIRLERLLAV
jgi:hypothetical protein